MGDLVCATVVINALRDLLLQESRHSPARDDSGRSGDSRERGASNESGVSQEDGAFVEEPVLDVLVEPRNAALLRGEPGIRPVSLSEAAARRYRTIVDLTSSSTSRRWIGELRGGIRIGSAASRSQALYRRLYYHHVLPKRLHGHIVKDFYAYLRHFGVPGEPLPALARGSDPKTKAVLEALRGGGTTSRRPLVGIHVGAGRPKRVLPEKLIVELADQLARRDIALLLIGEEPERVGRLQDLLGGRAAHHPFTLEQLKTALGALDVYVGVDSGPLHLACALGVPAVGLYGPALSERSAPLTPAFTAVEIDVECRPCLQSQPCDFAQRCFAEIPVERLVDAVLAHVPETALPARAPESDQNHVCRRR